MKRRSASCSCRYDLQRQQAALTTTLESKASKEAQMKLSTWSLLRYKHMIGITMQQSSTMASSRSPSMTRNRFEHVNAFSSSLLWLVEHCCCFTKHPYVMLETHCFLLRHVCALDSIRTMLLILLLLLLVCLYCCCYQRMLFAIHALLLLSLLQLSHSCSYALPKSSVHCVAQRIQLITL
jgi:hypothetical protein